MKTVSIDIFNFTLKYVQYHNVTPTVRTSGQKMKTKILVTIIVFHWSLVYFK